MTLPQWVSNRRIDAAAVLIVAVLVLGGAAVLVARRAGEPVAATVVPEPTLPPLTPTPLPPTPTPSPTPIVHSGVLDGVPMSDAEWETHRDRSPIAVMVDNSPNAYPQAGLDRADLVYEAFVEGGITRFMAVFWRQDAPTVMPVRSARTPFVIWASELGALYGHAGGASTGNGADAIGQISTWGIHDLDAFVPVSDQAYYRSNDRYAPYNLVTGTEALRSAAQHLGSDGPPQVAPWLFKPDGGTSGSESRVGGLEVDFQAQRYASTVTQWHWDPTTNEYLRFQSGGPHLDQLTNKQLRFKNVIVMRVPFEVVDFSGHVLLDQFGEGEASVFRDGVRIDGTWKKADRSARTRFFDATGREIPLNRGPIFIEVLGPQSLLMTAEMPAGLPPIPAYGPPGASPGQFADEPDNDPVPTTRPTQSNASPTAPGTATRTPSGTPSGSATPGTGTPRATGSGTPTGSASPAGSGTPSASASPGGTSTARPGDGTGTPTAPVGSATAQPSATTAAQPTATTTPSPPPTATVATTPPAATSSPSPSN